jgi:FkbM family methyltransferase
MPANRQSPFVVVSTDQGTFIVNRFDGLMHDHKDEQGKVEYSVGFGVGFQLLERTQYETGESTVVKQLLDIKRQFSSEGRILIVDCGANIGVHSVDWARHTAGWGHIIAIEPQRWLYYALCGNLAINNCLNTTAIHAAVGAHDGQIKIPVLDYTRYASFGSFELQKSEKNENIGQDVNYDEENLVPINIHTLDSMNLPKLDFVKIDVERMELDVLAGGCEALHKFKPAMLIETLKQPDGAVEDWLFAYGYECWKFQDSVIAVHAEDPALPLARQVNLDVPR